MQDPPHRTDHPVAVAVALLATAIGLHPVITPDFWWHLSSGRWILENGRVPHFDAFTYTSSTHAWVNLQWLGDVLLVVAYRTVGAEGLVLLKALALAGVAMLLFRLARATGVAAGWAGLAATLATLAAAERSMLRPEIVSYLMLATVLLLVEIGGRGRRWPWLALPLLTMLWVNLHSLAFLAPVVIALRGVTGRSARAALGCAALCALALLANPYGWAAWTFPLTLFERIDVDGDVFSRILEFASPWESPGDDALRFFWVALTLSIVGGVTARSRQAAAHALVAAPFLVLALLARRNIPLFVITVTPLLAVGLAALGSRLSWLRPRGAQVALGLLPALVLAALIFGGGSPHLLGLPRERGLGVQPGLLPATCMEALAAADPERLFNDMDFGGYVSWVQPERKTFIDGRLEVAGPDVLRSYVEAHESPTAWARVRDSWGLDALLLQHSSSGSGAFVHWLLQTGAWELACACPEAVLLVPTSEVPPEAPAPATWARWLEESRAPEPGAGRALSAVTGPLARMITPGPSPAAVRRAVRMANLYLTLDRIDEALVGYEAVLSVVPHDAEAMFNRGMCDLRLGQVEDARARWQSALDVVPRDQRERFRDALQRVPSSSP